MAKYDLDDISRGHLSKRDDSGLTTNFSLTIRNHWSQRITVLGPFAAVGGLMFYQVFLPAFLSRGTQAAALLEEISYITLGFVLTGLCLTLVGITSLLRRTAVDEAKGKSTATRILPGVLTDRRCSTIFLLSALTYGIFFGIISGTLVFRPGVSFSDSYGVSVPSVLTVVCCGPFGEIPQFVIYVTESFAILLVPINLILLIMISWLVGLNAGIAAFSYKNRMASTKREWVTGLGAILGLFAACPTCAGLFFMTILGLTGTIAVTLTSLQGIFVVVGIPLLMVTPIMSSRRIMNRYHVCSPVNGGYSRHEV